MKRIFAFLLILLLGSAALAEGTEVFEYGGACPHLLRCESPLENVGDSFFVYCLRCDAGCRVYRQAGDAAGGTHRFVLSAQPLEEGVYPDDANENAHQARRLWQAACSGCGALLTFFEELPGSAGSGLHSYTPLDECENFHLPDSRQHVYVLQCQVCGYTTGTAVTCLPLDNGLCSTQVTDLLEDAGADVFTPCSGANR